MENISSNVKFLYIDSKQIVKNSMLWGFIELNLEIERAILDLDIFGCKDEDVNKARLSMEKYDIAVSQDFIPSVAKACYQLGKKYISWVYDSPQVSLFREEAKYETNYIFMFDKAGVNMLRSLGVSKVFYLPLAANILQAGMVDITDDDIRKYFCEVSFVGQLYEKEYLNNLVGRLPAQYKSELDEYVDVRCCNFLGKKEYSCDLSKEFIEETLKYIDHNEENFVPKDLLVETLIGTPLMAYKERVELINRAALRYQTSFYTGAKDTSNIKANVYPPVDSETDAYKVYYSSKVNLNITWRGIVSGVPQRIFDIMSVGGFVLSNYQSEIEELFDIGKDIEVFHDLKEFDEKLEHYIHNDRERTIIGINGYKKVKELYNYKKATEYMLSVIGAR